MSNRATPTVENLQALALRVRYLCLEMTTGAQSGHLTSSLSAADLMSASPEEQRDFAGISAPHIVKTVKDLLAVREAKAFASPNIHAALDRPST